LNQEELDQDNSEDKDLDQMVRNQKAKLKELREYLDEMNKESN